MKKFLFSVISLAILAGFYSCKDNDPEFFVVGRGYGIQMSDVQFRPVVSFASYYGTFAKELSSITKDGETVPTHYPEDNLIEVQTVYNFLDDMSGRYSLTAVSQESKQDNATLTMDFDKALGALNFTDFEYSNGELKMKVNGQVENATHYGFYYRPLVNNDFNPAWVSNELAGSLVVATNSSEQDIKVSYISSDQRYDAVVVYPVAVRSAGSSTLLIRVDFTQGKNLKKGASSFED